MIESAHNYPVSQLFDIDSSVIYVVPRYQREYTWNRWHWEKLFDDILENDPGYFLGSIICINQTTDALAPQRLELVDGQQRLTSLSLLLASVYQEFRRHEAQLHDDQKAELVNLKWKLVLKKGFDQIRVIPQIQNNNQKDYWAVLANIGIVSKHVAPPHAGNRKIIRAFRYFQGRVKQMAVGQDGGLSALESFLDKTRRASMVKIEVSNHADAYTLFESLNNRGMPLTAIDLIKNKLLAKLEHVEPGQIDHYFEHWNTLLGYLGDDYGVQERFFRQYYNAFRDDLKSVYQVPVATRSNLMQIYENLIDNDAKQCLEKIGAAGRLYALLLFRNQDEALNGSEKPLKDLARIQGAPSYLLLLFLLANIGRLELGNSQLTEIVRLLVCFFVRRNLTDTPPTRDLTRFFMEIIEKLADAKGVAVVDSIRAQLVGVSAPDLTFRSKLEGLIYEENSGVTRFILCALAEQSMTKETWVDLWRFENKQFVWTIEHIFPQGEEIPMSWVTMIAEGDKHRAKACQQTHVHKLGNLTISGFNSALGNKSFEEKRDRTDRQGRPVGYKNGLKLNEELATADRWSVAQIDARTERLVNQVMALFEMREGSS